MIKQRANRLKYILAAVAVVGSNLFFLTNFASAGSLTNSYIRLNRMKANTDSTVRVVFKTTASAGATGLTIDFNGTDTTTARWTDAANVGTVSGTQAISGTAGCDVSATALPGSPSASGATSIVTVTGVTALSANTIYCFDLTTSNSVHTPTTAGEYHPTITETGGATDSITVATRVISNDQVVVNATVPPSFNFQISACTPDNFTANLSPTTHISTTGCTITVNTNAKNGWFAWAKNTGLTSTIASHTITAATYNTQVDLNASHGTEGYGIGITSLSQGGACAGTCGTTSAVAAYDSTATGGVNGLVGGLNSTSTVIASSTGTANAATLTIKARANINPTTQPATDYQDTITYIGAGYF